MSIDTDAIRARHLRPEQMEHRTFYEGHIVIDLAACVEAVEGLREKVTRDHATHMSREDWFASIIDNVEEGRINDRHAVIDFLRALGHVEAAEAIAKAGYPLFACLPPVTRATMTGDGGNTP